MDRLSGSLPVARVLAEAGLEVRPPGRGRRLVRTSPGASSVIVAGVVTGALQEPTRDDADDAGRERAREEVRRETGGQREHTQRRLGGGDGEPGEHEPSGGVHRSPGSDPGPGEE
jgi:hypothetical protein